MRAFLAAFVFVSLLSGLPSASHAAGNARLLVVDSTESRLSPDLGGRLHAAITRVASTFGDGVVDDQGVAPCGDSDCVLDTGRGMGATHVVWINATFRNESYTLNLEVWDVAGSRELGSDGSECAICANQDLLDAATERARAVLERTLSLPAVGDTGDKPAATKVMPPVPTGSGGVKPRLLAGAGLTLAGLGAGIAGIYYIAKDGTPVDGDPFRVRDTMTPGVAFGVAGATAFVCGVVLLTWHLLDTTTVAVGPGSVRIAGRF
jgi:hypothetical protein